MADTAAALVKAVIAALKAETGVTAVVAADKIFTDVKQESDFPYLTVSVSSEPFASNSFSGQSHTVTIHGFSRERTIAQALAIRKAALDALDRHEEKLVMDEGTVVLCQYSGVSDAFIEDDGKTWQSVGQLNVVTV